MSIPELPDPSVPKQRRRRRWRSRALWGVVGTVGFVFIAVVAFFVFLATPSGRDWAATQLLGAVSTPGQFDVSASGAEGTWPFQGALTGVEIQDGSGVWLTATRLSWRIDPWALMSGRLHMRDVTLDEGHMTRMPEGSPEPGPQEPFSIPRVPDLPVSLRIDRVAAAGFILPAEVAGIQSRFDLSANGRWEGRALSFVMALRQEGSDGTVFTAGIKRDPQTDRFQMDIFLKDRAGGVLASLLGEKDLGPVTIQGEGDGQGTDWNGFVEIDGAQFGTACITGTGGWATGKHLDVVATVRPGPLWTAQSTELVGNEARMAFQLGFPKTDGSGTAIGFSNLSVVAGDIAAEGDLQLTPDADAPGGAKIEGFLSAKLATLLSLTGQERGAIQFTGGDFRAEFKGALSAPDIRARLNASDVLSGGMTFGSVRAEVSLGPSPDEEKRFALSLDATVDGFDPNLDDVTWPYGRALRLTGAGTVDPNGGKVTLAPLRLSGAGLGISVQGDWAIEAGARVLTLDLDANHLAAFASDVLKTGRLHGQAKISQNADEPLTVDVDMELSGLTHAEPATTTLIGESAKITGRLTVPSDGGITFSSLIFVPIASGAKITASGQLKSAGSVNGNAVVTLPSIAILSNYAGLPLKGAVTAKATVTGTTNAPVIGLNLSSNAVSIRDLTLKSLNVQANYNADRALRGAVTFLTDDEDAHQLEGLAKIKSTEIDMQALSGSIFGVTLAKGNKPQSVRLVSDNLTPFGKALTQALGPEAPGIRRGSLDMALAMGPGFEASLQGRKLFIDIGGGDLVRIGTASVSAKIGNADDGSLRASSDLTNVVWGDNRFSLVKLVASGTTTAPDFSLNAEEGARNGARVSIKGRIRPDDGKGRVLTLTQTEGRLGDASIDLIEPMHVTLGGNGIIDANLKARVEDRATKCKGTVNARFNSGGHGLETDLTLEELPFGLLRYMPGMPQIAGRANGYLSFSTHADKPRGVLDLTISGLGRTTRFSGGESVLRGSWNGAQAVLTATLGGGDYGNLRFVGTTPLRRNGTSVPVIPPNAQVSGTITGEGHMEDFWPYLPLPQHEVTGAAELDLSISGPFERPQVIGTAKLAGGTYESLASGLTLRNVNLNADLQGRSGRLTLDATDGSKGRMTGAGQISFAGAGFDLDTDITLKELGIARRDDIQGHASGAVKIGGDSRKGLDVTGRIEIDEAKVKVPDQMPPTIVNLDTQIVSGADLSEAEIAEAIKNTTPVLPIRLDINIVAKSSVSVEGRGLQSTWNADAQISGLASGPRIKGMVSLAKGKLDFISRDFTLSKGQIIFDGGPQTDPRLNIEARHSANGITAIVLIQGTASSPSVKLSSQPVMKQDEVLAQLLFGKRVSELSTVEVLQIAQVLATLSGGGGGVDLLGKARDVLGIDVLKVDVDTASDNPAQNVSVTVGKYVSERVYVGVKQGTQPGSSAVTLEVDITDTLKLKTDVAQSSESSIGVTWQKDY